MTISQWFHSVWFIAPFIIFTVYTLGTKIVDRYFDVSITVKRRPRPEVEAETSIAHDPTLTSFFAAGDIWGD